MKRLTCLLLVLLLSAAAGCAGINAEGRFTADNEIFTYRRIDTDRTQIVVSRTGNINVESLCAAFEKLNPDVQVIYIDITGGNGDYNPFTAWIAGAYRPDIAISSAGFVTNELTTQYLENLSMHPVIQLYESSALQRTAFDSNIYCLPGPSDINAIMYNKTLFEQYGWEVPATFDEFVALCDRITADTGGKIEPWNPNAKYSNELLTAIEAFTYEELFGGADNRSWYNNYIEGKASFSDHMEPYMEVLRTLTDHGILREEHFTYSATTRGEEFAAGKIAMVNSNIFDADNEQYDFSFMPYPTTKGNVGYVCDSYSCFMGLPKKEHTDAEQDAIDRFVEFFSSEEGQRVYIGNTLKASCVKGVQLNADDDFAALSEAMDMGHMFAVLDFAGAPERNMDLYGFARSIAAGEVTGAECIAAADMPAAADVPADTGSGEAAAPEPIVDAPEDMTVLETSFYIADMYRGTANADVGLIAHNEAYRGNLMRVFSGDITSGMITVFKPRSFANGSMLVKASMTGQQLLNALNDPVGNKEIADCIYAYSGLKCKVAPWNDLGTKYLSVSMADGTPLVPDKQYTVAFWDGTIKAQYLTGTVEPLEGTWEEHMSAWLAADGKLSFENDGRIELVWE